MHQFHAPKCTESHGIRANDSSDQSHAHEYACTKYSEIKMEICIFFMHPMTGRLNFKILFAIHVKLPGQSPSQNENKFEQHDFHVDLEPIK